MTKLTDLFFAGGANAIAQKTFDGVWKEYTESDVTVTCSAGAVANYNGKFVPYRTDDGDWRIRFNIYFTHPTSSSYTVTIDGITYIAGSYQSISFSSNVTSARGNARANSNNTTIGVTTNTSVTSTMLSGDVRIINKPTWADFDPPESELVSTLPHSELTEITIPDGNISGMGTIVSAKCLVEKFGKTVTISWSIEGSGTSTTSINWQMIGIQGIPKPKSKSNLGDNSNQYMGAGFNRNILTGVVAGWSNIYKVNDSDWRVYCQTESAQTAVFSVGTVTYFTDE